MIQINLNIIGDIALQEANEERKPHHQRRRKTHVAHLQYLGQIQVDDDDEQVKDITTDIHWNLF